MDVYVPKYRCVFPRSQLRLETALHDGSSDEGTRSDDERDPPEHDDGDRFITVWRPRRGSSFELILNTEGGL